MMEDEDVKKKLSFEIGQELSELSVEELEETIAMLREEISRLENAKLAKSDHLSAAEALFAKKD